MRLVSLFLIIVPTFVLRGQVPEFFRPLDKSTLNGVWETILPYGDKLIHIEIRDDKGFLALVSSHAGREFKFVYPLTSYSIAGSQVKLDFVQPNPDGGSIIISGKGYAAEVADGGLIIGTLQKADKRIEQQGEPVTFEIFLRKGTWTSRFNHLSKVAEEAIHQEKAAMTVETGNISNIPIYNQTILSGEWAPSWNEGEKALRSIQLFLEHPTAVTRGEKQEVLNILVSRSPYRVQFIGVRRGNRQIILCNFFVDRSTASGQDTFPNWKKEKVHGVNHGGPDFWQIEYDPKRDACLDFSIR